MEGNKSNRRKAQMRWLPFVMKYHNINLDDFYVVSFWDSGVTLQGKHNPELISRIQKAFSVNAIVDDAGYTKIIAKRLEFNFT